MQTKIVEKGELNFVGLKIETSNMNEMEPSTAKIPDAWEKFFEGNISAQISNKTDEDTCYGVYSDFADGADGKYILTIGSMVKEIGEQDPKLSSKTLPKSKYMVFTSEAGPIPKVLVESWVYIWNYFREHPEYQRSFTGDFELYDERCNNPQNSVIDIYISIK